MKSLLTLLAILTLWLPLSSQAHHSFAIYDIGHKIKLKGVLKQFTFSNPHIQLLLEVPNADGSTQTWRIESKNPRRWNRAGHPRNVAKPGESVTILGWPARDGNYEMLLSTIITDRETTVIIDKVRQKSPRQPLIPTP